MIDHSEILHERIVFIHCVENVQRPKILVMAHLRLVLASQSLIIITIFIILTGMTPLVMVIDLMIISIIMADFSLDKKGEKNNNAEAK